MPQWVLFYGRWFGRAVLPGLNRADAFTAIIQYVVAVLIAWWPASGRFLNMTPIEIFGWAALAIIGFRMIYLPYKFSNDLEEDNHRLRARLEPKFAAYYAPQGAGFERVTGADGATQIRIRMSVVAVSDARVENCEASLVGLRMFANGDWKSAPRVETPIALGGGKFSVGKVSVPLGFVVSLSKENCLAPDGEGLAEWPNHFKFGPEPAKYEFRFVVQSDTQNETVTVNVNWNGAWDQVMAEQGA